MLALVNEAVVAATQENQIGEARWATIDPMLDVVSVTPAHWPVTAFESATAVSQVEGPAQGRGDGSGAATHIKGFGFTLGDDAADAGIAGDPAGGFGGDHSGVVQLARLPGALLERFQ